MLKEILGNDLDISWMDFVYRDDVLEILNEIDGKYKNSTSPSKGNILRFMKQNLETAKYVLYGQDPYLKDNGRMVATGRCFEPANYDDWLVPTYNASLRNILRAIYGYENSIQNPSLRVIRNEIAMGTFKMLPPKEFFDNLENQGILLLNYGLTVGKNAGSHLDYWHEFQKKLIQYMNYKNSDLHYIIWGDVVAKLIENIQQELGLYLDTISDYHPCTNKFVTLNKTFKNTPDIKWH